MYYFVYENKKKPKQIVHPIHFATWKHFLSVSEIQTTTSEEGGEKNHFNNYYKP